MKKLTTVATFAILETFLLLWWSQKRDEKKCVDCGEITDHVAFGGELRICSSCLNDRLERAYDRRQAEIKTASPRGPSVNTLVGLAFLVCFLMILLPDLFDTGVAFVAGVYVAGAIALALIPIFGLILRRGR